MDKNHRADNEITLLIDPGMSEDQCDDLVKGFSEAGIRVGYQRRRVAGVFNAMDWTIPTVVTLFLFFAKPYLETFAKKAAEDNYSAIKKLASLLWRKFIRNSPEIPCVVIRPDGAVKDSVFNRAFSITVGDENLQAVLLFQKDSSREDVFNAIKRFIDLCAVRDFRQEKEKLTDAEGNRMLIFMNPNSQQLELIDVIGSIKAGTIISFAVPDKD